ncbi:unnamed protein product, partial [Mesorhabditis spiculigera]
MQMISNSGLTFFFATVVFGTSFGCLRTGTQDVIDACTRCDPGKLQMPAPSTLWTAFTNVKTGTADGCSTLTLTCKPADGNPPFVVLDTPLGGLGGPVGTLPLVCNAAGKSWAIENEPGVFIDVAGVGCTSTVCAENPEGCL